MKSFSDFLTERHFDKNVGTNGVDRDKLKNSDFAGKNRSFPIVVKKDVADAWTLVSLAGDKNYSRETIKKNILKIAKRKGLLSKEELEKYESKI